MLSGLASTHEVQALMIVMPILAYVIVDDLRFYRIRNEAVLALLILCGAFYALNGDATSLRSHLGFGLALFIIFLVMYRLRMMGGGDVKLLTVAIFWIGMESAILFSALLAGAALVYAAGAKFKVFPSRTEKRRVKVPFGPSIAAAWISTWIIQAAV